MDYLIPMGLSVQNLDLVRPTFLDVDRDTGSRRQVIGLGETFHCMIAAGPAVLTFGHALAYTFVGPEAASGDE